MKILFVIAVVRACAVVRNIVEETEKTIDYDAVVFIVGGTSIEGSPRSLSYADGGSDRLWLKNTW